MLCVILKEMAKKQIDRLNSIETQMRMGDYDIANNLCVTSIADLKQITFEDLGNATTIKIPWIIKAIGGLEDITTPDRTRNSQLILLRMKTRLMQSLILFYNNETELGTNKLDESVREINAIRDKLDINHQNELNKFLERIKTEIKELHLLSAYLESETKNQEEQEIDIEQYLKMSEEELYLTIGNLIPSETKVMSKVLDSKILLLVFNNKILIPPSSSLPDEKETENITFGKRFSNALKKSLYNILCDPKDRVGKNYVSIDSLKKLVSASLISIGITKYPMIAPFVALVFMFGIGTYCEMSKPEKINNT